MDTGEFGIVLSLEDIARGLAEGKLDVEVALLSPEENRKFSEKFIQRQREIYESDEDFLIHMGNPFYGDPKTPLWFRLTSGEEPHFRGWLWDATCNWKIKRHNLPPLPKVK